MKYILFAVLLMTNALFAENVAAPPHDKITGDVTITKFMEDGTYERVCILYSDTGSVIQYDLSDSKDQMLKRGSKKLVGRPKDIIESTIDDIFKVGSLRLGKLMLASAPAKNRVEILVHRMKVGTWQTNFDKEQTDAWSKASQFIESVAKIAN